MIITPLTLRRRAFYMRLLLVLLFFSVTNVIAIKASVRDNGNVPGFAKVQATGKDSIRYQPFDLTWEGSERAKLSLARHMDKPAGRDGFIQAKDGHFVKPNGQRFKIWGMNLAFTACFPEKKDAPKVAAYLARFGINAVRLHFLDANFPGKAQSLLANGKDHTRELSPDMLDKLDFFIAELKKAGVYSDINLNVGRYFRKGDGVAEYDLLGLGKGAVLFDDRLIELQKEYAKQLLTHFNPYTGNTYANEPAIVLVEVVNENTFFDAWKNGNLQGADSTTNNKSIWKDIPPYYGKQLTQKYNVWLKQHLTPAQITQIESETKVRPGTNIPRMGPKEFNDASILRFHSEARFMMATEREFHHDMYRFLKQDLGVRSLVIGNSDSFYGYNNYAFLRTAADQDVVDAHSYWHLWEKPVLDKDGKKRFAHYDHTPMVLAPWTSTIVRLSRSAVEGKPFTVSEVNNGSYNPHYTEGVPLTGAYAALQDWDGIFYFTLSHEAPDVWNTYRPSPLDCVVDPIRMANVLASGLMFGRGDVEASVNTVYRGYDENDIIEGVRQPTTNRPFFSPGFSRYIPLLQRTRISSFEKHIADFPVVADTVELKAETGQITWHNNYNSYVEVSSPRSEALIGYMGYPTKLKHLTANVKNEFASITLVALDEKIIGNSDKLLLVTTAKCKLTGATYNATGARMIGGRRPTLIEPVTGKIVISGLKAAKNVIVEPLDGGGNPIKKIRMPVLNGVLQLPVGKDVTVWYHLTVQH